MDWKFIRLCVRFFLDSSNRVMYTYRAVKGEQWNKRNAESSDVDRFEVCIYGTSRQADLLRMTNVSDYMLPEQQLSNGFPMQDSGRVLEQREHHKKIYCRGFYVMRCRDTHVGYDINPDKICRDHNVVTTEALERCVGRTWDRLISSGSALVDSIYWRIITKPGDDSIESRVSMGFSSAARSKLVKRFVEAYGRNVVLLTQKEANAAPVYNTTTVVVNDYLHRIVCKRSPLDEVGAVYSHFHDFKRWYKLITGSMITAGPLYESFITHIMPIFEGIVDVRCASSDSPLRFVPFKKSNAIVINLKHFDLSNAAARTALLHCVLVHAIPLIADAETIGINMLQRITEHVIAAEAAPSPAKRSRVDDAQEEDDPAPGSPPARDVRLDIPPLPNDMRWVLQMVKK